MYFGGHLLTDTKTPVAIAEGEKNAILGALYYPQYNWLAVGSQSMLNVRKLNALYQYDVTLFPDKGKAFVKWSDVANKTCFEVKVNDTLENTSLVDGDDIADLIIEIKTQEKRNSPSGILERMKCMNPNLTALIEMFDLKPC